MLTTGKCPSNDVTLSDTWWICPSDEITMIKPSSASNVKWVYSSFDKHDGFQFSWISWTRDRIVISIKNTTGNNICIGSQLNGKNHNHIPLYCLKKLMVDLKTVALSILRFDNDTNELSSFTNKLNWSRRFFSFKLRDILSFWWKFSKINRFVRTNQKIRRHKKRIEFRKLKII